MKEIAVLVSGGVDSSVALSLLHKKNLSIRAYYLKIWLEDELSYLGSCPWEEDLEYAQKTCDALGVPLEIISFQNEYWKTVVSYTIEQIKKGFTPNPDILCNREIKLGAFLSHVHDAHDYVATGHYARRVEMDNTFFLGMTDDKIKDQTYFLAQVPYEHLKKALFPIGDLVKSEVREYAIKHNLPAAQRPDSQGICFLGKIKFKEFVRHHLGVKTGKIIEWETKKIVGSHEGYWFYTIGQRQGLGLAGGPWYVVAKCIHENSVFVSRNYYSDEKERKNITITHVNWLPDAPVEGELIYIKLRHGPSLQTARVVKIYNDYYDIVLSENDQGIAPGQFAVIYSRDYICKGSGILQPTLI